MKTQLTIQELAAEIAARAERKEDFIADTREIRLQEDGKTLALGSPSAPSATFDVTAYCHGQIREYTEIPANYYKRCQAKKPHLLARNVNEWFDDKPGQRRMVRTLDGNARAFLSDKYNRIDDDAFANIVLPVIGDRPDAEIVSTGFSDERTHIKFVSKRLQRDVKVGDPVQFGIAFSNSEIGAGRIQGSLLIYRLICLNGAIAPDEAWGATHVGARQGARDLGEIFKLDTVAADGRATLLKLRDFASDLLTDRRIDAYVEKLRDLTRQPINKPAEAVEKLAKSHGLNDGEKESVLAHLIRGGDLSMWGLKNAVTAAAQDADLSYGRATELETLGGKLVTLNKTEYRDLAMAA